MGWGEIGLILVVGVLLFGPERLPEIAGKAAQWTKTIRRMAEKAKAEISDELPEQFKDVKLRDLDPRVAIREAWNSPLDNPVEQPVVRPAPTPTASPANPDPASTGAVTPGPVTSGGAAAAAAKFGAARTTPYDPEST